jgi:AcrR family transcriptional regulator
MEDEASNRGASSREASTPEASTREASTREASTREASTREVSTRERILDVALDLFVDQGYDKTSLREIAEKMGFSKAALYYHFASKSDILMGLHLRMHSALDDLLPELEEGPTNPGVWERFLDGCIDRMLANRKLFLMHQINQSAFESIHAQEHAEQHQGLEERARKLFSDQSVPARQRSLMAASFAAVFITPMMAGRMFPESELDDLRDTLRDVVRAVLKA